MEKQNKIVKSIHSLATLSVWWKMGLGADLSASGHYLVSTKPRLDEATDCSAKIRQLTRISKHYISEEITDHSYPSKICLLCVLNLKISAWILCDIRQIILFLCGNTFFYYCNRLTTNVAPNENCVLKLVITWNIDKQ